MKNILLPSYLVGFNKKVDGSASLRFNTQEISSSLYTDFAELQGEFGWLAFRASETEAPDLPEGDPERKGKTLSERLYNTLYVRWRKLTDTGETDETFEHYRRRVMESFIEKVKSTLD